MNSLTDLEILNILTDDRELFHTSQIASAQIIAEKRGLDVYLYLNDREAYHRISRKEKVIDNRASNKLRFINYLLDLFICILIIIIIDVIVDNFGSLRVEYNWDNYFKLWIIGIRFIYYSIQEGIWNRTLGKLVTKTLVVTEKNQTPTLSKILMRTACRFIPLQAFSFLFMKNGFHDTFSKTKVIEE